LPAQNWRRLTPCPIRELRRRARSGHLMARKGIRAPIVFRVCARKKWFALAALAQSG